MIITALLKFNKKMIMLKIKSKYILHVDSSIDMVILKMDVSI